ncbi:MAG: hypothetical protein GWN62_22525, partial [Aliifodinibius sp.]|nr:hypothetical protein [Fodinibius sp.]
LRDAATQTINSAGLTVWNNRSSYFNGDAVEIALYVAPGDKNIFFKISEIIVGEQTRGYGIESICGT